jgi:hypothetical protein
MDEIDELTSMKREPGDRILSGSTSDDSFG